MKTLVPFVAQLFVRGPEFRERFVSRFGKRSGGEPVLDRILDSADNTNLARVFELQRLLWPVMVADWMVLRNRTAERFLLNDLGYAATLHAATGRYGYSIPLLPDAALVVSQDSHPPGLYWDPDGERWMIAGIAQADLDVDDVLGFNSALAAQSLEEVYAPTREAALGARHEQDRSPRSSTGLGPEYLVDSADALREHEMDWFRLVTLIGGPPPKAPDVDS